MILDMTFTLKMFRQRQLGQALESLKLGGYFDKVISVHPLAGLFESGDGRLGEPLVTQVDESLVFVEGKLGISRLWRFIPPVNFLLAQIQLVRLLIRMGRDSQVNVVRVGDPYYLGLLGLFLAKVMKVPLAIRVGFRYDEIFRVTGRAVNPRLFVFRWVEKVIERIVFPRCDLIAGANTDNMQYALENGGRASVATVFRYGNLIHQNHWLEPNLRKSADEILAELGLSGDQFIITVARLEPMKYVEDAIRVIAELKRRGHRVKGLLVGDGSLRENLQSLAETLNVKNEVIFAGNRNQEWLASVLPRAAVILSPHMGRALTEAALAGVPIAAYDYDWQREVVVDAQTGYLAPHKDWIGLSDKTELILTNPTFAKKMGEGARKKVAEMMNPERLEQHEKNEYSKMFRRFQMEEEAAVPAEKKP